MIAIPRLHVIADTGHGLRYMHVAPLRLRVPENIAALVPEILPNVAVALAPTRKKDQLVGIRDPSH
jgi:predicted fused transcriptional regulator/phosphomethylpyrimidine kinase